jgi:hypothetical protein
LKTFFVAMRLGASKNRLTDSASRMPARFETLVNENCIREALPGLAGPKAQGLAQSM